MRGGGYVLDLGRDDALAIAFGLLGDEWNLWILAQALRGARRYSDWAGRGKISNSVLTGRLGRLTDAGLLDRVVFPLHPARPEYVLTDRGRAVWPILVAMWWWEREWAPEGSAGASGMRHVDCGAEFAPVLVCGRCREPAGLDDVIATPAPSGGGSDGSRRMPAAASRRRPGGVRRRAQLPHTMELVGDRWSAVLLGAASFGATRFGVFAEWTGAPSAVLADRLRVFTELGVLSEHPAPEHHRRVTYHLTRKGREFFPVVATMIEWGRWWFGVPDGGSLSIGHRGCAGPFSPRLVCSHCSGPLQAGCLHRPGHG